MSEREFIEEVFKIAFGDDAMNRDLTYEEVFKELLWLLGDDGSWGIDMDSSDAEMLQEQLRKFSPPQLGE